MVLAAGLFSRVPTLADPRDQVNPARGRAGLSLPKPGRERYNIPFSEMPDKESP